MSEEKMTVEEKWRKSIRNVIRDFFEETLDECNVWRQGKLYTKTINHWTDEIMKVIRNNLAEEAKQFDYERNQILSRNSQERQVLYRPH